MNPKLNGQTIALRRTKIVFQLLDLVAPHTTFTPTLVPLYNFGQHQSSYPIFPLLPNPSPNTRSSPTFGQVSSYLGGFIAAHARRGLAPQVQTLGHPSGGLAPRSLLARAEVVSQRRPQHRRRLLWRRQHRGPERSLLHVFRNWKGVGENTVYYEWPPRKHEDILVVKW